MFKIKNWPNRKFSKSVDGKFGKFDPKLEVLDSRELSFGLLINLGINMNLHGSEDVLRYPFYLVEASGRKLNFLVKIENDLKMAFACGAVTQKLDVI